MPRSGIAQSSQQRPASILLVEDEAMIRLSMAEALLDFEVSVVDVGSADEAWSFSTTNGPVDLVFTDHRMPGSMTGAQLAARIREHFPSVVVVLTSAYRDLEHTEPVLKKPYDFFKTAANLANLACAPKK